MATAPRLDPTEVAEIGARLAENISLGVKAPERVVRELIVALLADGHVLIEDAPGVGKTALARALARSLEAEYARVQCTSDLLPADLVGTNVFNQRTTSFEFHPGPVFANVVLVDEINRASPKTQSGLLECMQERQITIDGTKHELARPFVVLGDPEPGRVRGHLSAARSGARSLHGPGLTRLSGGRSGGVDARASMRIATRSNSCSRSPTWAQSVPRRQRSPASRRPRRCAATWSRSARRPGATSASSSAPARGRA